MLPRNYSYKYERKPDRFVYVQSEKQSLDGSIIALRVARRYKPSPIFFHFRRRGGHLSALKLHLDSSYFARFDIDYFFGRVTRTKVARCLREIGFTRKAAFSMAYDSVVTEGVRKIVPYGFPQSTILSTLVLEKSLLGQVLIAANSSGTKVSVYVDDIIISSDDKNELERTYDGIIAASIASNFPFGVAKTTSASIKVEAFNCHISRGLCGFVDERMNRFVETHADRTELGKEIVERYICEVSPSELLRFKTLL